MCALRTRVLCANIALRTCGVPAGHREVAMADFLRTDDVAEADRFAQWRHWISATFVPLECAQISRAPFRGEVAHWELGDMLVSRVDADPHLASRTSRMISMRDAAYYKVGLLTRGSCHLTQEGREAVLHPGDLAIYDCRRPHTMAFIDLRLRGGHHRWSRLALGDAARRHAARRHPGPRLTGERPVRDACLAVAVPRGAGGPPAGPARHPAGSGLTRSDDGTSKHPPAAGIRGSR
jgi:AraC-binding-like domain